MRTRSFEGRPQSNETKRAICLICALAPTQNPTLPPPLPPVPAVSLRPPQSLIALFPHSLRRSRRFPAAAAAAANLIRRDDGHDGLVCQLAAGPLRGQQPPAAGGRRRRRRLRRLLGAAAVALERDGAGLVGAQAAAAERGRASSGKIFRRPFPLLVSFNTATFLHSSGAGEFSPSLHVSDGRAAVEGRRRIVV